MIIELKHVKNDMGQRYFCNSCPKLKKLVLTYVIFMLFKLNIDIKVIDGNAPLNDKLKH